MIDGAEAARRSDAQAGREEQAQRQFTIATRCLIERAHPSAVARELGISERQCYRDRALIYERLGRYVSSAPLEAPAHSARSFDRLDLRFERSAQLADLGCEAEAARHYAGIAGAQESPATKLRALGLLSEVLLACGKIDRARAAIDDARAVLQAARRMMSEDEVETGACRIALARAKVAWDSGDFPPAISHGHDAVVRAEMLLARCAVPDVALCAEAFFTRAGFDLVYGRADEAREILSKARALAPRHGSARIHLDTTLLSTTLDTGFIAGSREVGADLRLAQIRRVADAAMASGLFSRRQSGDRNGG